MDLPLAYYLAACETCDGILLYQSISDILEDGHFNQADLVYPHPVSGPTFGTHLLEDGYDIRTIQKLLGHKDVKTTMIYTRCTQPRGGGVGSPGDACN